nr:galacturonokinase isoform X2 [Ipomoea batatas]
MKIYMIARWSLFLWATSQDPIAWAPRNEQEELILSDVTQEVYEAHKNKLETNLAKRAEHYFSENKRVFKGLEEWASGNIEEFRKLVTESGLSSIQNYDCDIFTYILCYVMNFQGASDIERMVNKFYYYFFL